MLQSFSTPRALVAAVLMACASIPAHAAPIFEDGTTTSAKEVTYKSEFKGDVLTLSIFADGATGTFAGINSLKSLSFFGLKPSGAANRNFMLDGATMLGASPLEGEMCGTGGGGQVCFNNLNQAIVAGTPLVYRVAFDYTGPGIDFDNFNVRATFMGERLNAKNKPVAFTVNETVLLNATEVPEPASLAMLGLGLGLVSLSRRRKARTA